jgi:hypothetical protein
MVHKVTDGRPVFLPTRPERRHARQCKQVWRRATGAGVLLLCVFGADLAEAQPGPGAPSRRPKPDASSEIQGARTEDEIQKQELAEVIALYRAYALE